MNRTLVPVLIALAAGCSPQNASVIQGDVTAYLSASTSIAVRKGVVDYEEYEYYQPIDCRQFDSAANPEENEALRLDGRKKICDDDPNPQWPPRYEIWLEDDGYHVVNQPTPDWRGEGIITSEGDVQIAFHSRMPDGQDVRWGFVVDPTFQPSLCVQNEAGDGVELVPEDGDWIGEWSKQLDDGGTLYYLNADAYQFDPTGLPDAAQNIRRWFIPQQWRAGHAEGKFSEDRMRNRATRYADPDIYIRVASELGGGSSTITESDLFYCDLDEGDDPKDSSCMESVADRVDGITLDIRDEFELTGVPRVDGLPSVRPLVEDNQWRDPDGQAAGIDGWVGMHYSWVKFDAGSELEKGGAASGEYNIVMDGTDSNSRFVFRGSFEVSRFKDDTWTTDFLPPIKFDEYDSDFCGQTEYLPGAE